MSFTVKSFESQDEVDAKRQRRQEEWEKVRKPDDPEACPEEPVDNRCLFDKLEEQRQKKQDEYDEKVALRNQVRRLDADETDFLDFCSERQKEIKTERKQEELEILSEIRDGRVIKVEETSSGRNAQNKVRPTQSQTNRKSQTSLLSGAVKRKGSEEPQQQKKSKSEPDLQDGPEADVSMQQTDCSRSVTSKAAAVVIAVRPSVLPGMAQYEDSSDSMSSSSDSETEFSLSARSQAIAMISRQANQQ